MRRFFLVLAVTIVIAVGVVALLFIQQLRQDQASWSLPKVPMPICEPLPERGPDHIVSLLISQSTDRPGIVCVRMSNGTQKIITYVEGIRLERRWLGLIWLPYIRLSEVLSFGAPRHLGLPVLVSGGHRDFYRPSPYDPALPGTYRVRLRYQEGPEKKDRTVYSAEFSIP